MKDTRNRIVVTCCPLHPHSQWQYQLSGLCYLLQGHALSLLSSCLRVWLSMYLRFHLFIPPSLPPSALPFHYVLRVVATQTIYQFFSFVIFITLHSNHTKLLLSFLMCTNYIVLSIIPCNNNMTHTRHDVRFVYIPWRHHRFRAPWCLHIFSIRITFYSLKYFTPWHIYHASHDKRLNN